MGSSTLLEVCGRAVYKLFIRSEEYVGYFLALWRNVYIMYTAVDISAVFPHSSTFESAGLSAESRPQNTPVKLLLYPDSTAPIITTTKEN